MKSAHSTIPTIRVAPTWHVTCTACGLDEQRVTKLAADLVAMEHEKTHGQTRWRDG